MGVGITSPGATVEESENKPEALIEQKEASPPPGPPLQGNDYQLEYYEDGYPKLPTCLDRKASK
jgi:hypothetical protein